jgi:hypothetical protein
MMALVFKYAISTIPFIAAFTPGAVGMDNYNGIGAGWKQALRYAGVAQ